MKAEDRDTYERFDGFLQPQHGVARLQRVECQLWFVTDLTLMIMTLRFAIEFFVKNKSYREVALLTTLTGGTAFNRFTRRGTDSP